MANTGIDIPILGDREGRSGDFLTFVVPAPDGCNLKCAFCVVRQRQEVTGESLAPGDLVRFIREAHATAPIFALAIQGYEPLLPASREYTEAVLDSGRKLGLPTGLVTNGVLLRDAVKWLAPLETNRIAVSVDAATADAHDRIRGVAGAWDATIDGIRHASKSLSCCTSLAVASVLTSRREPLDQMPALLRDLGIEHWLITPLQKIGRAAPGSPSGDRDQLYENLLILQHAADEAGISLTVDDELNCLQHDLAVARNAELGRLRVRTLPRNVDLFRLTPGGQCSMNEDILRRVTASTARWRPGRTDAGDFLARLKGSADPVADVAANPFLHAMPHPPAPAATQIPAYQA